MARRSRLTSPILALIAHRRAALLVAMACAGLLLAAPPVAFAEPTSTLSRPADPVVLTGADIPSLNGLAPSDLVAFRNINGVWSQLPVQVDERHTTDVGADIYRGDYPSGFILLAYSDPLTDMGADPNPTIDANDEIVFMAKDAGGTPVAFSEPANVVPGSGLQITITDPLTSQTGVVYLFEQTGALDPAAGQQYVSYTWQLTGGGTYLANYNIANGSGSTNNEDSDIVTLFYADHFSERWVHDELRITTGAANGFDILDRHASKFPGSCLRSEDTFSAGEGGFFVNKSGPVRALRSYLGANSGPFTQRENIFYERRQDVRTFLRVHAIGGIQDFFDYSPAAANMEYYNNLNQTLDAVIDGQDGAPADNVAAGPTTWELVTGPQGSLTQVGRFTTDIPGFSYTSLWLDDTTPPANAVCTGDLQAWGASGVQVLTGIPCTDPTPINASCVNSLTTARNIYYDAPNVLPATAAATAAQDAAPLTYAIAPWLNGATDSDGDTVLDANDNCPSDANMLQENNDRNFTELGPAKTFDDLTLPRSDNAGDICDPDDDNDGRSDDDENAGLNCGAFTSPTLPMVRDTDSDRILDGAECTFATPTNPHVVNAAPPSCSTPGDLDGDGVSDARELCYYGTSNIFTNSDGDGCGDGREVASVNADQAVNATDLSQVAQHFGPYSLPAAAHLIDFDITKEGNITATDLSQVAQRFGPCP